MLLLQCLPLLLEEVVSLQGYPFHHVLRIYFTLLLLSIFLDMVHTSCDLNVQLIYILQVCFVSRDEIY